MDQNVVNNKYFKYVISYNVNITDVSLNIRLESMVDFCEVLSEKELEDFVLHLIRKCTKEVYSRPENCNAIFANNICFFKEGDKYPFYSFKNISVQIYPLVK